MLNILIFEKFSYLISYYLLVNSTEINHVLNTIQYPFVKHDDLKTSIFDGINNYNSGITNLK